MTLGTFSRRHTLLNTALTLLAPSILYAQAPPPHVNARPAEIKPMTGDGNPRCP